MTKPHAGKLFYVPQRPYMTIGTLRDQIIYPDTIGNMKRKGFSDAHLKDFLDKVSVDRHLLKFFIIVFLFLLLLF